MKNPNPGDLPGTVMTRATSAPSTPRSPGRPGRPAVLARPASWPGCDPYRPGRRGRRHRMTTARRSLIGLLHDLLTRAGAVLPAHRMALDAETLLGANATPLGAAGTI